LSIIKLSNISKVHDQPIISDINLVISEGDFTIITGPSGCGKSTLLQIIGLLEPATDGEYILGDQSTTGCTPREIAKLRHDYIGFIFQRYHLIDHLNILDNVLLPLQYGDHPEGHDRAHQLLQEFSIDHLSNHHPHQLSYGQQQRVSIARAIISQPKIILADEPTGSLDGDNADIVIKQLRALHKKGQTVILITHNIDLIRKTDIHYRITNKKLERVS
jgi:putative ABC transport system ATP-binding protein